MNDATVRTVTDADTGVVTRYDDDGGGGSSDETEALLLSVEQAIVPVTNTGTKHLTGTLNLQELGVDTGRCAFMFLLQLPKFPCDQNGAGGFPILQYGSGAAGTILLQVVPIAGSGAPNMLTASIVGDAARRVTVRPHIVGPLLQVFLEYNGSDLTLVVADSADTYHATSIIPPPTGTAVPFLFGSDASGLAFDALKVYNTALSASVYQSPTTFPYFLWDGNEGGVLAVMPITPTPGTVYTFVDRGYLTGHQPAALNLASSGNLPSNPILYVNEQAVPLAFGNGMTDAAFVTALTTNNSGVVSFLFDGKTENIKFTWVSATSVTAAHYRGGTLGQMSFSVRMEAGTGNDWSKTVAIIGKIPQQFYLPHTGKLNEGVSIIGATKQVSSPKALKLTRRDDQIRTVGSVIGSIKNRPVSRSMLQTLDPIPWYGAAQAPFPKDCMVWGDPNSLNSSLDSDQCYSYGVSWFKYLSIDPADKIVMKVAPNYRSRIGDNIAGFSLDIPFGKALRGIDINFTTIPPGLVGNSGPGMVNKFDWGWGYLQFPMATAGTADYTLVYMLMVATDDQGTKWRPIPSIGVDAVKVSGANTWKSISFKNLDYQTLLDDNSNPLLLGSRRTHFKVVLAAELTAVAMSGLSYSIENAPKK